MQQRIKLLIDEAYKLKSDAEARDVAIGLMRIILQHLCIGLAEWIIDTRMRSVNPKEDRSVLPLETLRMPADGSLVSALADLLVAAENEGWSGVSRPYWKSLLANRPAARLISGKTVNVDKVLKAFVQERNDDVVGHGIAGSVDREALLDAVSMTIDQLEEILPSINHVDNSLYINSPNGVYVLKTLRTINNNMLCYRKIQKTTGGKCLIQAQEQVGILSKTDVSYETDDVLGVPTNNTFPQYQISHSYHDDWHPFVKIPEKMTLQFTGRSNEINELRDWIDDTESRACMLYGDGGIGKTTLVVEFLHRMIDGDLRTNWKPELITFYTAKQTYWGLNGLETRRSRAVNIMDVSLDIVRSLESSPLDKSWFDKSAEAVISKLAGYLNDWGIPRNSHLLVLDNTETMVNNDDDVKALSLQIRELSRRVGRILITSRRREPVEARQIEINTFDVEESVRFLQKRAEALKLQPILNSNISKLSDYAQRLGNKPLVLEVFIQALRDNKINLDSAFDRVLRMQRQDLGEFLYSDSWNRMTERMKHLMLLMTRISDTHDEFLLKLCCQQVGITVLEADEAFEESRGIASLSTIGQYRQITFNHAFLRFCEDRSITIRGITYPTKSSIEQINNRYNDFLRSQEAKIRDRVGVAYRHHLARAAWQAAKEGRDEDAELYYDEAILKDSSNGALFDRYAYFLFIRRRYSQALEKSIKATSLIKDDADAWFTRGMIEARLGNRSDAIKSLTKAAGLGKAAHLCLIQQAYAYLRGNSPDKVQAIKALKDAEMLMPTDDPYYTKNKEEIASLYFRAK